MYKKIITRSNKKNKPQGAAELVEQVAKEQKETPPEISDDSCSIPGLDKYFQPEGLLSNITKYMEQCNVVSHPVYNLACAISFLGTIAGQQVSTAADLRTNFYCIIIGRSGSGKESPVRAIGYLTTTELLSRFNGISSIASGAALLKVLERFNVRLLTLDELGKLLYAARSQNGALHDIIRLFMELFTKTTGSYDKHYADDSKNFTITGPHVSIFGSSTPNEFYESLGTNDVTAGFLPRCLIFPSDHPPVKKKSSVDIATGREELQRELEAITLINNPNQTLMPEETKPVVIHSDIQAKRRINRFRTLVHEKETKSYKDDIANPIYSRLYEHGMKLALIHAVSRCGADIVNNKIASVDCRWGFGLAEVMLDWMVAKSPKNFTGGDRFSRDRNKVLGILARFHGEGSANVSKTILLQYTNLNVNILNPILQTLVEAQEVEEFKGKSSNGKQAYKYRLITQ